MDRDSLYLSDTQRLVRTTVQRFVTEEIKPYIEQWETAGTFPRELYQKAGQAGILGICHPEAYGGTGEQDLWSKLVASEELMRSTSGGVVAGLGSHDIGLPPVWRCGSEALKNQVVAEVLQGEKIMALAVTEASGGSDVAQLRTRAVRQGEYYVVNGSKSFITSGLRADYYTVAVRTGSDGYGGISLLLIPRETPGFTRQGPLQKMGWWPSDTAELFFDDCRVPVANLIGAENTGFYTIMSNFQQERLSLAIMAYITAELAYELSLDYVRQRKAFGRPVAKFQVIKHKLATMATQIAAAKAMVYEVTARMARGETVIKEISMAKNFTTEVSDYCTHHAVQLFGGAGYMQGSVVERLYRDNRILSIGGGTYEIMNEVISKQIGL